MCVTTYLFAEPVTYDIHKRDVDEEKEFKITENTKVRKVRVYIESGCCIVLPQVNITSE